MKLLENISYGFHPAQLLDVYLPETADFPTFVYIHGGGFEARDKTFGSVMAAYLAEHGVGVVCVGYRKYPEAVYPEYIRDSAAAVAWAHKNMPAYGANGKLFVGGSSAGGYASMMLCFDKRWLAPYKLPADAIAGWFHDAGQPTTHFNVLRERGIDSRRVVVDEAAPLYHIGETASYAPMHFIVCDNDIASRYEQTMLVLSTLRHFKYDMSTVSHQVLEGKHCWYITARDEAGDSVLGKLVLEFISRL